MAAQGIINVLFIGRPSGIGVAFFEGLFIDQTLVKDLVWTLAATLAAFLMGSAVGILVGLLFVVYPASEEFWDPIMSALNALPRIALAPLFLLWFGLGISSKIALGFSLTFFIVLSSTVAGARSVDPDLVRLAQTLGAKPAEIFRRITLMSATPTIFSGLRLGLIYALLGVIAGEIIAAQHGLGQRLTFLAGTFQINGVFAVLLLLGVLGSLLTRLMSMVEARLLAWR
ncbi:MAG: ABC transporter permease [Hyphomicrobiaceae bacterium]